MGVEQPKTWLPELELMRAFAIIAVVIIHLTGIPVTSLPKSCDSYLFYFLINRFCQFAVPSFIFISALLLTRDLGHEKEINWKLFYRSRCQKVLFPYLIWSLIYIAYTVLITPHGFADIHSLKKWLFWLLCGKAHYHLYFLAVIIQFYIFFPLLLWFCRRIGWNPRVTLLLTVGLQIGVYWLYITLFYGHFPQVTKPFLWYLSIIFAGMLVGCFYEQWSLFWKKWGLLIALISLISGVGYIYWAWLGFELDNFAYQASWYFYVTSFPLLLLAISRGLQRYKTANIFYPLGRQSFGIYLLHPLLIALWGKILPLGKYINYHLNMLGSVLTVLTLSCILVYALSASRLGVYLFGLSKKAKGKILLTTGAGECQ